MSNAMKLTMPRFDGAPVLVVGDVMLDRYWHGPSERISPEAPVPVIRVDQIEDRPGGAGNVALNIAALGARSEEHTSELQSRPQLVCRRLLEKKYLPFSLLFIRILRQRCDFFTANAC